MQRPRLRLEPPCHAIDGCGAPYTRSTADMHPGHAEGADKSHLDDYSLRAAGAEDF
jgi:hypothetical protein